MIANVITKQFVTCPNGCAGWSSCVDHLINTDRIAGPWYCDVCLTGWRLQFFADGRIEMTAWDKLVRHVVLLELPPQSKPLSVLLRTRSVEGTPVSGERYLYNEHTCPTNWMHDVTRVVFDGDADPHGLFEFRDIIADKFGDDLDGLDVLARFQKRQARREALAEYCFDLLLTPTDSEPE